MSAFPACRYCDGPYDGPHKPRCRYYTGEGTDLHQDASAGDRPSHAEPLPSDIREALRQLRRDEMWTGMRTPNSRAASERTDLLVEHIVAMYESAVKRGEK